MTGIFLDVTGRNRPKRAMNGWRGELSHRVKNLLAIAAGLTKITQVLRSLSMI